MPPSHRHNSDALMMPAVTATIAERPQDDARRAG